MNIKEFIENYSVDLFLRKQLAIFKDKKGTLEFAIIISDHSSNKKIYIYNEQCNLIGSVRTNHYPFENIYLYNLYIEPSYRNLNIASHIIELIEYETNELKQSIILGIFKPFEFTENRRGMTQNEEIIERGKNELITFEDYSKNREKYSLLYKSNFGEHRKEIILYKKIESLENNFTLIDGILIHNNALEDMNRINDTLESKKLKIH